MLLRDGRVECIGDPDHLGYQSRPGQSTEGRKVETRVRFRAIDSDYETCGISRGAGELWCWGKRSALPKREAAFGRDLQQVSVSLKDICVVKRGGEVWCASRAPRVLVPRKVFDGAKQVVTSGYLTCATRKGNVWCWGTNTYGQLGRGFVTPSDGGSPAKLPPGKVKGLPRPAKKLVVGVITACALLVDNTLWCWGDASRGFLADGRFQPSNMGPHAPPPALALVPRKIPLGKKVKDVPSDPGCALLEDGTVWAWGPAGGGLMMGKPSTVVTDSTGGHSRFVGHPVELDRLGSDNQHIYSGGLSRCVLKRNRKLVCWGENEDGQIKPNGHKGALGPTEVHSACGD